LISYSQSCWSRDEVNRGLSYPGGVKREEELEVKTAFAA
jgi:hypothetical protein